MAFIQRMGKIKLVGAFCILCLCSCQNDTTEGHQDALPHNLNQSSNLNEKEVKELANAAGKSVGLISQQELGNLLNAGDSKTIILNFWKLNCLPCLEMQQSLQLIQNELDAEKLDILAINLDVVEKQDAVNLAVRKHGVSSSAYQIMGQTSWSTFAPTDGWDEQLPALVVWADNEVKAFFQQHFSENELRAVLAPFLILDE